MDKKLAVVGAVLDRPNECQVEFNNTVSSFKDIVKGRMGLPFESVGVSVISIIVYGTTDEINSFTGKLGRINGINVKTAFSKREIEL